MDPSKSVYLTSLWSGGACLDSSRTNEDIVKKSKKVNLSSVYIARDPGMFSSDCIYLYSIPTNELSGVIISVVPVLSDAIAF
ncbi:hypothetical protein EYF80_017232 [Liparis tanakae]|uniref:Uncharacterized protein n=1 Tax=Liparis tanakae TaxID=230148 RepID=A0A4Z2I303_9TELE|nr:hypothetical protein EYF80_017232 [Liparis tanakae]